MVSDVNDNERLLHRIRQCTHCEASLPLQPKPVLRASSDARILVIGQAPGIRVHRSGIPWHDPSGERLRDWLGVDDSTFYDEKTFAIMPMGFCYPGKGKSGDLPPRTECAPLWHPALLDSMPNIQLTLLIGQFAQNYYLKDKQPLTQRVKSFETYLPDYFVLPHPSPRNNLWLARHPWFESHVIPHLKNRISRLLAF
ncbi:uracil-DNA glycosylase family protein [Lacimicrobium sp. SS2-24]|uniref:uracil-DNA glycosylase family protein n=1 Tax=Lacimicrobium sp. SS2-24 TaxID=2005569 RepID=UPI000B4B31BC|nr:uracil-DNA glycosylase family protein [Lacimicrobium sp. SS2-24]